jgi:DNA-directed RNA polymerase specialized sigma24 family protein
MEIPSGMSEEEVKSIILKVAQKLAPKYVFASYDVEDIEQEAFIIALEALERYDTDKPLENFLYTHVNNRLKNFKRDNYYRQDHGTAQKIQDRKKNLLEPIDIDCLYSVSTQDSTVTDAHIREVTELIDKKLPSHLRRDYLKLRNNSPLPKSRKANVIKVIEDIINGEYHEEG